MEMPCLLRNNADTGTWAKPTGSLLPSEMIEDLRGLRLIDLYLGHGLETDLNWPCFLDVLLLCEQARYVVTFLIWFQDPESVFNVSVSKNCSVGLQCKIDRSDFQMWNQNRVKKMSRLNKIQYLEASCGLVINECRAPRWQIAKENFFWKFKVIHFYDELREKQLLENF